MGFNEEERQSAPPPWGWPPAAKEKAHGVGEIVYHGAVKTTRHTKDRRHEQKKAYHKTRSRATPHGQAARDAGHGMERICEPVRADIAAALRKGPQHPVGQVRQSIAGIGRSDLLLFHCRSSCFLRLVRVKSFMVPLFSPASPVPAGTGHNRS